MSENCRHHEDTNTITDSMPLGLTRQSLANKPVRIETHFTPLWVAVSSYQQTSPLYKMASSCRYRAVLILVVTVILPLIFQYDPTLCGLLSSNCVLKCCKNQSIQNFWNKLRKAVIFMELQLATIGKLQDDWFASYRWKGAVFHKRRNFSNKNNEQPSLRKRVLNSASTNYLTILTTQMRKHTYINTCLEK